METRVLNRKPTKNPTASSKSSAPRPKEISELVSKLDLADTQTPNRRDILKVAAYIGLLCSKCGYSKRDSKRIRNCVSAIALKLIEPRPTKFIKETHGPIKKSYFVSRNEEFDKLHRAGLILFHSYFDLGNQVGAPKIITLQIEENFKNIAMTEALLDTWINKHRKITAIAIRGYTNLEHLIGAVHTRQLIDASIKYLKESGFSMAFNSSRSFRDSLKRKPSKQTQNQFPVTLR